LLSLTSSNFNYFNMKNQKNYIADPKGMEKMFEN